MTKPPAFQFYARDWVAGTVHLSLEARGAYVNLLCHQWDTGPLPDDSKRLGRLAGASPKVFERLWRDIEEYFPLVDGRRINSKLERVRRDMQEFHDRMSEKGRAGAAAKWRKHSLRQKNADGAGNAHATATEMAQAEPGQESGNGAGMSRAMAQRWPASASASALKLISSTHAGVEAIIAYLREVGAATDERLSADQLRVVQAEVVFAYWVQRLGHKKAMLDPQRLGLIVARLKENRGDLSELLYVVDGAMKDDWAMGRDRNSKHRYDGIEVLFRNRAQVERFSEMVPDCGAGKPHPIATEFANAAA